MFKKHFFLLLVLCSFSLVGFSQATVLTVNNLSCDFIDMDIATFTTMTCTNTGMGGAHLAPGSVSTYTLPGGKEEIYFINCWELSDPSNFVQVLGPACGGGTPVFFPNNFICNSMSYQAVLNSVSGGYRLDIF